MPLRAVGTANFAVASATRRSQAIASWVPAPIAGPLTAAIERNRHLGQAVQHPVQRLEEFSAIDATEVGTCAERRTLTRDDDGPGSGVDGLVDGGVDLPAEVEVERIATLLALQLEDDDIAIVVTPSMGLLRVLDVSPHPRLPGSRPATGGHVT